MIICGRIRRATVREDIDHALQRAESAASLRLARAEYVGDPIEIAASLATLMQCSQMRCQTEDVPS